MTAPIVVDTGFVLSVAAVDGLPPLLGKRWGGRTAWPDDVQSELVYRRIKPGGGIPAGLATKALNSAGLWLPKAQELTADQDARANTVAERLGGTTDKQHRGEAASAVLAQDIGGVVATEDLAAIPVLRTATGVLTTNMSALLERLHADGDYDEADVAEALKQLQAKQRPNVHGLTSKDIIEGTWRARRR